LANFPLLGNITFSPFAGGGNVMGAQRVRPLWVTQVFFVFSWLDMLVLAGHLIFSCNFLGWVLTLSQVVHVDISWVLVPAAKQLD
jgi:hypothetical protein